MRKGLTRDTTVTMPEVVFPILVEEVRVSGLTAGGVEGRGRPMAKPKDRAFVESFETRYMEA